MEGRFGEWVFLYAVRVRFQGFKRDFPLDEPIFDQKSEIIMQWPAQFTRNADHFFLEVELDLEKSILSFLLVSTEEDRFYELRLANSDIPLRLKTVLPTTHHLYVYLLKNHNHQRSFQIDSMAQMHITIPLPNDLPISVVLPTKPINDEIMPYDLLDDELELQKPSGAGPQQIEPFFKKQKRKRQSQCLDIQNTQPVSSSASSSTSNSGCIENQLSAKNIQICRQVEKMLLEGCEMRIIRKKLRLTDRTAFKMFQQFKKYRRVFSPEQGRRIRQNERARALLKGALESNHSLTAEAARDYLLDHGISRDISFFQRYLQNAQIVYYSEESGN